VSNMPQRASAGQAGVRTKPHVPPLALSIDDAAAASSLSRSGLYALIREGRGPIVRKIGKRSVIRIADLDAWLLGISAPPLVPLPLPPLPVVP
jgi:predicted DNA-binding transcriptional regulator AlpA